MNNSFNIAYKGMPSGTPLWVTLLMIVLVLAIAVVVRRTKGK